MHGHSATLYMTCLLARCLEAAPPISSKMGFQSRLRTIATILLTAVSLTAFMLAARSSRHVLSIVFSNAVVWFLLLLLFARAPWTTAPISSFCNASCTLLPFLTTLVFTVGASEPKFAYDYMAMVSFSAFFGFLTMKSIQGTIVTCSGIAGWFVAFFLTFSAAICSFGSSESLAYDVAHSLAQVPADAWDPFMHFPSRIGNLFGSELTRFLLFLYYPSLFQNVSSNIMARTSPRAIFVYGIIVTLATFASWPLSSTLMRIYKSDMHSNLFFQNAALSWLEMIVSMVSISGLSLTVIEQRLLERDCSLLRSFLFALVLRGLFDKFYTPWESEVLGPKWKLVKFIGCAVTLGIVSYSAYTCLLKLSTLEVDYVNKIASMYS